MVVLIAGCIPSGAESYPHIYTNFEDRRKSLHEIAAGWKAGGPLIVLHLCAWPKVVDENSW